MPRSHVDDGKIFKVDTVPPPPGESDAYNAPTRVGTLDAEEWQALMGSGESGADLASSPERAGGKAPLSQRPQVEAGPPKHTHAIPPPAPPPPPDTLPRIDVDEDDDDVADARLSWPALGAAAMIAVQEVQRAASTAPPPQRLSAFPEWVAGTNVQEKAAHEAARRRRIRTLVRCGLVVTLALGGLVAAVLRH